MSSYVSINSSPAEVRALGHQLETLGEDHANSSRGIDDEFNAEHAFGSDKFGQAMREVYPQSEEIDEIVENDRKLGQSCGDTGAACKQAMDLYEQADDTNSVSLNQV